LNYVVFYSKDPKGPIPIGMAVYNGVFCKTSWFFIDAERDTESELWPLVDKLFFKMLDGWQTPYKQCQEEYWNYIREKLPPHIVLTQPKPLDSLLDLRDYVICPETTSTMPGV